MAAIKSDKIEYEKRVRIVQEWILQDHLSSDIVDQCMNKWGVSDRQAKRYLSDAHDGFRKITERKAERRLNFHIQRRMKLIRDMDEKTKKSPAGIAAQLQVLKDIADLEQLYHIQIDLGGSKNAPPVQLETTHTVVFEKYQKKDG